MRTFGWVGAVAAIAAFSGCTASDREFGSASGGSGPRDDAGASGGANSGGSPAGGTGGAGGEGPSTGGSSNGGSSTGGTNSGGSNSGGAPEEGGVCAPGMTDCDDAVAGCETDLDSLSTCGTSCGDREECKDTNAAAVACTDGKCVVTCAPGFANCDGKARNGCEVDLSAPSSCGTSCETRAVCQGTTPSCATGACVPIPSCAGLDKTCGHLTTDDCCANTVVEGGTFNRGNNAETKATVSDFRFDKYEVTVGRFRKFVAAWVAGYRPAAGDGKHAHLNGGKGLNLVDGGYEAGWDPAWTANLGTTADDWNTKLDCGQFATWIAGKDYLPMNCVSFWESAAFCTWDGGFLPTEAEWEYAAAGGPAQRAYPWGNDPPVDPPAGTNPTLAAYGCLYNGARDANSVPGCTVVDFMARPGTLDTGRGFYFQYDLAGNVAEWALDHKHPYPAECVDCVNRTPGTQTVSRGGGAASPAVHLATAFRGALDNTDRWDGHGVRCARRP